ncbi:DnaB-like helicase C-terminal domain-containing protein [Embleya sp. AB8]|uniref:DnaB-like helicase C-terminal domain-containing protein n=1 Tax=Embleya sp. AB8 TaxID=3156304 RepID=UPI003C71E2A3
MSDAARASDAGGRAETGPAEIGLGVEEARKRWARVVGDAAGGARIVLHAPHGVRAVLGPPTEEVLAAQGELPTFTMTAARQGLGDLVRGAAAGTPQLLLRYRTVYAQITDGASAAGEVPAAPPVVVEPVSVPDVPARAGVEARVASVAPAVRAVPAGAGRRVAGFAAALDEADTARARAVSFGVAALDEALGGGALPGRVLLVTGAPGAGAGLLAAGAVLSAALADFDTDTATAADGGADAGAVLFCTPGRPRADIAARLTAAAAGVDHQRLRAGTLTDAERRLADLVSRRLGMGGLLLDDGDDLTLEILRETAADIADLRLVVVDALNHTLRAGPAEAGAEPAAVRRGVGALRRLAADLDIAVVAVWEQGAGRDADVGAALDEADTVVRLTRDGEQAFAIVAERDLGPIAQAALHADMPHVRFTDARPATGEPREDAAGAEPEPVPATRPEPEPAADAVADPDAPPAESDAAPRPAQAPRGSRKSPPVITRRRAAAATEPEPLTRPAPDAATDPASRSAEPKTRRTRVPRGSGKAAGLGADVATESVDEPGPGASPAGPEAVPRRTRVPRGSGKAAGLAVDVATESVDEPGPGASPAGPEAASRSSRPSRGSAKTSAAPKAKPPRVPADTDEDPLPGAIEDAVVAELAAAGGDLQAAGEALARRAIPDVMELLRLSRAGARYDHTYYPPQPELFRKRAKDEADAVWEARPKWRNAHLPAGEHEVTALDTNAAYLSALKAFLPIGPLEHREGPDLDDFDGPRGRRRRHAGVYLVDPPKWEHEDLPNPLGDRDEPGPLWITDPTLRLLLRCASSGYGRLCEEPRILESWTAVATENLLERLRIALRDARDRAIAEGDDVTLDYVKQMYAKLVSTMGGSNYNREIHRPDWMHIIRSQAFANLWVKALRAHQGGLTLVRMMGTDELHLTGGDWHTVFTEGRGVGDVKIKDTYTLQTKERT